MKKYNVIIVYNQDLTKLLFCKRAKEPYLGLYNLVGGKIEENEDDYCAAYRELYEETHISSKDIELTYLMRFEYKLSDIEVQTFVGKLNHEVSLIEEVNALEWLDVDFDFFSLEKFAGEGNIGHMLEQVKIYKDELFK